jgi:hypothetical protein
VNHAIGLLAEMNEKLGTLIEQGRGNMSEHLNDSDMVSGIRAQR